MRTTGKGQKLDVFYKYVCNFDDAYNQVGENEKRKLQEIKEKTLSFQPKSDYEIKDKNNLIQQIERILQEAM